MTTEKDEREEDPKEVNGVKRTRGKGKEPSHSESSSTGAKPKKKREEEKASTSRRRRRVSLQDFPMGRGMIPYNLIQDLQGKGPTLNWPQFFALCPSMRKEISTLVSTRIRKSKSKEKNTQALTIAPLHLEDAIVPTLNCYIKGKLIQKALIDGGAQICIMTEQVMHKLGLRIHEVPIVKVKMADNSKAQCLGVITRVRVETLGIK